MMYGTRLCGNGVRSNVLGVAVRGGWGDKERVRNGGVS